MSANTPKVLLRSEHRAGAVAVIELTGSAKPPLHRHDFDETFYLLEGELTFQLGDDLVTRRAGELAFPSRRRSYLCQPERCPCPGPAHLYPGRVRALLRPHRRPGQRSRPAARGRQANPRGHYLGPPIADHHQARGD
jgi:hypothetical protein